MHIVHVHDLICRPTLLCRDGPVERKYLDVTDGRDTIRDPSVTGDSHLVFGLDCGSGMFYDIPYNYSFECICKVSFANDTFCV